MNLFTKKPVPSTLQEYKISKIHFELNTMTLGFFVFFAVPLAVAFSAGNFLTTGKSASLAGLGSLGVGTILVLLFNRYRVKKARRLGLGPSLKLNTFIIKDENVDYEIKSNFWELINKELNKEEKATFNKLLNNFDGSIEDLILVAKDFGPEKVKIK